MDEKLLRRINSKVNPFLKKLFDYPGKILPGFDTEADKALLSGIVKGRSLIVEFGSGSGHHLIELAKRYPECLVLGFEIRFKRAVRTIEKEPDLENMLIFRGRSELVADLLPPRSVKKVFINFPDPWDKKRWLKHRILSAKFFNILPKVLLSNAVVSVKTDHREYFLSFLEDVSEDKRYLQVDKNLNLPDGLEGDEGIRTEFEGLFRHQGKEINFVKFKFNH